MKFLLVILFQTVGLAAIAQTQKVLVYHPEADAKADIQKAEELAKKENKNILIQIGGNWCSWCLAFNNLTNTDTAIHNYLNKNYEIVHLNYSKENKNLPILAELGYPQRFGFPVFVVLDKNGHRLNTENSSYLETGDGKVGHDPKKVFAFLKDWSPEAINPATYTEKQ
ncbi:thioredoxin family protein [Rhizosphaericola mali]|uniref:Thioredoxin family protein n=1 Tax=Rhizosphaericola mali TaxID=2545455 RepID=A0A5P2FXL1_9BACT|nr:thioredoxin family protein [Rhizosphaericola mali]QES88216.1 thioredoxin family protein [Rhizosphaericola mali]